MRQFAAPPDLGTAVLRMRCLPDHRCMLIIHRTPSKNPVEVTKSMIFHATLEQAEDGWVVAECPALPGCVSQGKDEQRHSAQYAKAIAPYVWLWRN